MWLHIHQMIFFSLLDTTSYDNINIHMFKTKIILKFTITPLAV